MRAAPQTGGRRPARRSEATATGLARRLEAALRAEAEMRDAFTRTEAALAKRAAEHAEELAAVRRSSIRPTSAPVARPRHPEAHNVEAIAMRLIVSRHAIDRVLAEGRDFLGWDEALIGAVSVLDAAAADLFESVCALDVEAAAGSKAAAAAEREVTP